MRAFVTGGAGFLGRYVVERLRAEGSEVVAVDIDSHGQDSEFLDVTDLRAVLAALSNAKPDIIIHLAALAGAKGKGGGNQSIHDPYQYFRTNVNGTLTVFEACRLRGVQKVIHMSSFSPYGATEGPINETTPFKPANPYGFSKECAELVAACYGSSFGIKTLIFRAPLLCGEGQEEENALREFVLSVKNHRPIVLYGNGDHVREWLHPSDVAEAFIRGIANFDLMKNPYEVFVLGGNPTSMKELARLVTNRIGGSIQYKESTHVTFDQYTDTTKAKTLLKWEPRIAIQEIADRVIADIMPSR